MASMLEVLREYKHLAAKRKSEGPLSPSLQARYDELEAVVKAEASRRKNHELAPSASSDIPRPVSGIAPPLARGVSAARPPPPRSSPTSRIDRGGVVADNASATFGQGSESWLSRATDRRELWTWAAILLLISLGLVLALTFGLAANGGMYNLLRGVLAVAIGTWLVLYPALLAWREWAAGRGSAHLSEPDFRATTPIVEPVVALATALAAVVWLLLGDYADEGLPRLMGYLAGLTCWLTAFGWTTVLLLRPYAARHTRARAYRQYSHGGVHALEKNNTKRARRLLALAVEVADDPEQRQQAMRALKQAYRVEADELRARGYSDRGDELMRSFELSLGERRGNGVDRSPAESPPTSEAGLTVDLPPVGPPRVLAIGDVEIERSSVPPSDHPDVRRLASMLSGRGRHREALEQLVDARLAVSPDLARAAAQEYIQQGILRSADAVYDALGESQIPEFYKAVAVEWSRQEGAPPEPMLRLAPLLERLGESQVAARICCQGVLSGLGPPVARRSLADLAVQLCAKLGQEPPPEVLEAVDNLLAAGDAYRRDGQESAARRCYQTLADRLIDKPDQRELLIPILNRLYKLDKFLDDRYLTPLVDDLIENRTSGPQATRVLMSYRSRHRDDHRVTVRLFELMVQHGQVDDALKLLKEMSGATGSNPDSILQHFEMLRRRFPDDLRIEVGEIRAMIKAGRIQDAAGRLQVVLPRMRDLDTAKDAMTLIESVFEWGHPDPELRNGVGQLFDRLGDKETAISSFEQYAASGGRDPAALRRAAAILSERLVTEEGAPSHTAHLRLARFHLVAGAPQEAIPFLEVARSSRSHRTDADLLLARAELAASNPRRAVQVLRDAIDGRHPRDTPQLHYELARVYDQLGERNRARQIDDALEEYAPDAVREYQQDRPLLEKRDTEWLPAEGLEQDGDTDVGGAPVTAATEAEATYIESDESVTLEEALAPRYSLSKRIGAGGMGDVYLARDEVLGRPVAIKVLRRTLATDLFISKFRDEARIVAKLSHPGIVSVYDIGQHRDWSYIVMEYVRGPNLSALVSASMPPSRHDLVNYVAAVADAMAYAHEQGVIHRDLKPANILIGHDGRVKVTDFGIAHVLHGDGEETAFSAAGLQVGTVNYMAPEQLLGRTIDARTDVYLLGTTLYYTLCRRYPFMGDAVAMQKLKEAPAPLAQYVPDVSSDLDACVRSCLERDPDDRFQRMEELALVLRMVPEAQSPPPP